MRGGGGGGGNLASVPSSSSLSSHFSNYLTKKYCSYRVNKLSYFRGMTDLTVKNFVVKMSPSTAINKNCIKVIMFPAPGSSLKYK